MEYLKSMLANRESVTADTVVTYDLPVNPLSFVDIDIEAALSAAYTQATLANLAAIFDRIEVLFKGTSMISLTGADLLAFSATLIGRFPPILNRLVSAASEIIARFRIPFGRYPYATVEAFPAVRKGELQLRLDYASAFTNITSLDAVITTCELPGATPKQFIKATTLSKTPVVGDNDIDLPLGNQILGLLIYSATVPAGAAKTTTVDKTKLLVENVEKYLHEVRWAVLNQRVYEILGKDTTDFDHTHRENVAGAYAQNAETEERTIIDQFLANYGLVDFDPLRNDAYLLETADRSRIWLRINAGDTGAIRVVPMEIIKVAAG